MNLELKHLSINGIKLAYFENEGEDNNSQTILLVHGLAFHARCWDALLRRLNATQRVLCPELRGHGRSEKRGPYNWHQFGRDLCVFIHELDLKSIVAVGHSIGGHILIQAASVLTRRFDALVLLDPVVFSPRTYASSGMTKLFDSPEQHPFARSKAQWKSAQQWFDEVRVKSPFNLWDEEVLWDHCFHGIGPAADGQCPVLCPPLVAAEAALNCVDTNIHPMLPSVNVPTTVVRAKTASGVLHPLDSIHSTTWPELAAELPQGTDRYHPDLSHFLPMQRPDLVVQELRGLLVD